MNVRASSFSLAPPSAGLERRPSVVSRLSSAFSNAENGDFGGAAPTGAALIEEEIAEIKRYEVSSMRGWTGDPVLTLYRTLPR